MSDEPTGFVWIEKDKIAASGYPASRGQLQWLAALGLRSILSLTPEPLPKEWFEGLDLVSGHIPMQDHAAPDAAALDKCADFVQSQLASGRSVVVHCLAGEGRTGCALAAFMIKERHLDPVQVLMRLRGIKHAFVEEPQERALFEYADSLKT